MSDFPKLFRVTLEVADLERATQLYAALFGLDGQRYPGARHYFDCGGVIVAVLDVSRGGMAPTRSFRTTFSQVSAVREMSLKSADCRDKPPVRALSLWHPAQYWLTNAACSFGTWAKAAEAARQDVITRARAILGTY